MHIDESLENTAFVSLTSGFPVHPDKQEFNDLKNVSYATSRNRWSPVDLLHP